MVEACVFYSLIGFLDPSISYSDAARDVVSFEFGERTVPNPELPAPCSSYMKNLPQILVDVILQAAIAVAASSDGKSRWARQPRIFTQAPAHGVEGRSRATG